MVRRSKTTATTSYVIRRDTQEGVMVMASNHIAKEGCESIELIQQKRRNLWKDIQCVTRYASPTRAFRSGPSSAQKVSAMNHQSMHVEEGLMAYEPRSRESSVSPKPATPEKMIAFQESPEMQSGMNLSQDVAKEEGRDDMDGDDNMDGDDDHPKTVIVPRELPLRSDDITHVHRSFQSAEDHACCNPYPGYDGFFWSSTVNTATKKTESLKDAVPETKSSTNTRSTNALGTRRRGRRFSKSKNKNSSKRRSVSPMRRRRQPGMNSF